jgi:iron(III) transport system substrate-binding protein
MFVRLSPARIGAVLFGALLAPIGAAEAAETVNVYTYREPVLIEPILKAFTDKTGIAVNMVFSKDGLVERLAAEGKNSPADVLITAESGLLVQAKAAGVTQSIKSEVIDGSIPASLRDPEGHWFGLTRRARVVYASKDRVAQDSITYEELADPKWKGKICVRSGQHTYNIALLASMIANDGEEKAEKWLTGLRDNLARKPAGGDREGVRDVNAGLCDIAIGNTYYMVQMLKNPEQKPWADSVKILFPNADGRGTHVNVSGAAVTANAPHRENAIKLLEYMVSPEAQHLYAEKNGEYPVVEGVAESEIVQSWGPLKPDPLPLSKIAVLRKQASELVDKVKFDAGPSS